MRNMERLFQESGNSDCELGQQQQKVGGTELN